MALSLLFAVIATLWITAAHRSRAHQKVAQQLEAQGELARAASHYQWSARAYSPFSATGDESLHRLWRLYKRAIKLNQRSDALRCLDLIRGAIWSTRWLLSPYAHWAQRIDEEILKLRGGEVHDQATLARALRDDPRPSVARSLSLLLAVLSLVISVHRLFVKGISDQLQGTDHTAPCLLIVSLSFIWFWITIAV